MTKQEIIKSAPIYPKDLVSNSTFELIENALQRYADQEVAVACFEQGKRTGELIKSLMIERDEYKAAIENYVECLTHWLEMHNKKASKPVLANADAILKKASEDTDAILKKYSTAQRQAAKTFK